MKNDEISYHPAQGDAQNNPLDANPEEAQIAENIRCAFACFVSSVIFASLAFLFHKNQMLTRNETCGCNASESYHNSLLVDAAMIALTCFASARIVERALVPSIRALTNSYQIAQQDACPSEASYDSAISNNDGDFSIEDAECQGGDGVKIDQDNELRESKIRRLSEWLDEHHVQNLETAEESVQPILDARDIEQCPLNNQRELH